MWSKITWGYKAASSDTKKKSRSAVNMILSLTQALLLIHKDKMKKVTRSVRMALGDSRGGQAV
jgi:hypothetical protein